MYLKKVIVFSMWFSCNIYLLAQFIKECLGAINLRFCGRQRIEFAENNFFSFGQSMIKLSLLPEGKINQCILQHGNKEFGVSTYLQFPALVISVN